MLKHVAMPKNMLHNLKIQLIQFTDQQNGYQNRLTVEIYGSTYDYSIRYPIYKNCQHI